MWSTPTGTPPCSSGVESIVRVATALVASRLVGNSSGGVASRSGTCTVRRSRTARPLTVPRSTGSPTPTRSLTWASGSGPKAACSRRTSPSIRQMRQLSAPQSLAARSVTASSTGWRSAGAPAITRSTSAVAVCCSRASVCRRSRSSACCRRPAFSCRAAASSASRWAEGGASAPRRRTRVAPRRTPALSASGPSLTTPPPRPSPSVAARPPGAPGAASAPRRALGAYHRPGGPGPGTRGWAVTSRPPLRGGQAPAHPPRGRRRRPGSCGGSRRPGPSTCRRG